MDHHPNPHAHPLVPGLCFWCACSCAQMAGLLILAYDMGWRSRINSKYMAGPRWGENSMVVKCGSESTQKKIQKMACQSYYKKKTNMIFNSSVQAYVYAYIKISNISKQQSLFTLHMQLNRHKTAVCKDNAWYSHMFHTLFLAPYFPLFLCWGSSPITQHHSWGQKAVSVISELISLC